MKKLLSFVFLMMLIVVGISQTASIKGVVKDESSKPLPGVEVVVGSNNTVTNVDGIFEFQAVAHGKIEIYFYADGYQRQVIEIELSEDYKEIPEVTMKRTAFDPMEATRGTESNMPLVDLDESSRSQNVGSLLTSSRDVFVSVASFNFSAAYFRMRGYDNEFSQVSFAGLTMNNAETGRAAFSLWGGLNDATRFRESTFGLNPARYSVGNLGGTTNFDIRPSNQRKQTKISYAYSNRTYNHRVIATTTTGLMDNGWAFTFSGSKRIGTQAYVDGVFYDAWAYFAGAEKKINDQHSIALVAFGAPTRRGMQSASVQEAYDLTGSNYYNPSWGYQNGEVRNSRVREAHEPVVLLTHYFDVDKNTKLTTTVGYIFGTNGSTALNWYNAADPRPDYYRYLPSYHKDNPAIAEAYTQEWMNDPNRSQINWDKLYQINYLSAATGSQSRYIIEDRRVDQRQYSFSSILNKQINSNLHLSTGIEGGLYRGRNYKVLKDLLGGSHWVDVDQFAERDFSGDTTALQNDLNNPNRVVNEGDVFGYDYIASINRAKIWGLSEFTFAKYDFYGGFEVANVQYWREGNMKNGRFAENSFGKSDIHSNIDYVLKGGFTYKITGRHYVSTNVAHMSLAPSFRNTFISPRTRDEIIPNFEPRQILSADLNYDIRYPGIKGRFTIFHTSITNDSEVNSFYHDELRTFVNHMMTNVEKVYQGIEAGLDVKINSSFSVSGAASHANYRYTSRPEAIISADNGSIPNDTSTIYIKNFYVSGTPQKAYSLGLKYQHPKYLFVNINANYFDDIWIDFNPERRTERAIANLGQDDERLSGILNQIKADPQFTVDLSIGKSWRIRRENTYFINLNFNINNILDNTSLITNGYEQNRFDFAGKNVDKFPPKYYYGFGRTYFLMLAVRF
jgi:hypothetical protein